MYEYLLQTERGVDKEKRTIKIGEKGVGHGYRV